MARFLGGLLLGIISVPLAVFAWFQLGHTPVAVSDPPLPMERFITHVPLHARIDREMVKTPPIPSNEQTFIAGAHIYREQCAACHGLHGLPSSFGEQMFPDAPPLWQQHKNSTVVGVSDDEPGETAWKVSNGIRLTGMPAYKNILSEEQIWQVSLLLANADKPMPTSVIELLKTPLPPPNPTPTVDMKPVK